MNKRIITTREQIRIDGIVQERIATHIVTGAHGYETLCTRGHNKDLNDLGEVIHDCAKIAENALPVTCSACFIVWYHTHEFQPFDFNPDSKVAKFTATELTEINL